MTTLTEKELSFTFPDNWQVEHFDTPGTPSISHFQPVDFVVETSERIIFIEVKDPSNSKAPDDQRKKFVKKMQTDQLTHQELVPKARTSWSFLCLMRRATKPIVYIVAIGAENLRVEPVLWSNLTGRLKARLKQEIDVPWPLQYVESCIVIPAFDLHRHLSGVSVQRVVATP